MIVPSFYNKERLYMINKEFEKIPMEQDFFNAGNYIGIDLFAVSGFKLLPEIDLNYLKKFTNATILEDKNYLFFKTQGISCNSDFSYIKINDSYHGFDLIIGVKQKANNSFFSYIRLTFSINDSYYKNLFPYKIEQCKQRIKDTLIYIKKAYRLDIIPTSIYFNSLEINANIQLDHDFSSYSNILELFTDISPKTYKSNRIYKNHKTNKKETFEKSNKSISFKFYDKTAQMYKIHGVQLPSPILRFEYSLKTIDKIKQVFNTHKLDDITDASIDNAIRTLYKKDFIKPLENFKREKKKDIEKLLWNCINLDNSRFWIRRFTQNLYMYIDNNNNNSSLTTFDIEIIKSEFFKISKNNAINNWNNFIKECPNSLLNIDKKIDEINRKILFFKI